MIKTALLALGLAASVAAQSPLPAATASAINSLAAQALTAAHLPGMAVGVARDGQLVFAQGYGLRDVAAHALVDAHTRFQIGSITKQFTAACILQLRDAGKLSLDDRLAKFAPKFPHASEITLRQLLNQTSGLYNFTDAPHFESLGTTEPGGLKAIEALVAGQPLAFSPGSQWQYSNTNYIALGAVVAKASGISYRAYLQRHIFNKVGMRESGVIGDPLPDLALGYVAKAGKTVPVPSFKPAWAGSAGYIVSTVGDLAKWDAALSAGTVIPSADYAEMTTAGALTGGKPDTYGFGWMLDTHAGQPRVWHNGGTSGFLALNARYPGDHLDILVLINSTALPPMQVANQVFAVLDPQQAAVAPTPPPLAPGEDPVMTQLARRLLEEATTGKFDRTRFTPIMNAALTPEMVAAVAQQFTAAGPVQAFTYRGKQAGPGQTGYVYRVTWSGAQLDEIVVVDAAGKIAGLLFRPVP